MKWFAMLLLPPIILVIVLSLGRVYAQPTPQPPPSELARAQLENLQAQTDYYKKQAQNKSGWERIEPILGSLLGTLLGALLTLVGVRYSSNQQWQMEKERWWKQQMQERQKDARLAAVELSKVIAGWLRAIIWLTYIARREPQNLTESVIAAYEQESKGHFHAHAAAEMTLITLDERLYRELEPPGKELLGIDDLMNDELVDIRQAANEQERAKISESLGDRYLDAKRVQQELTNKMDSLRSLFATDANEAIGANQSTSQPAK